MKKVFLIVMFSAEILTACAKTKCNIKKAYAFYTVSMPGLQMVDENDNAVPPVHPIERFICIESKGGQKHLKLKLSIMIPAGLR